MRNSTVFGLPIFMVLATLVYGIFQMQTPRCHNLGPAGRVRVSSGRDVHRHDLVRQWGWPIVFLERHRGRPYAYHGNRYVRGGPTPAEYAGWLRGAPKLYADRASWEQNSYNAEWLQILANNPKGAMWRFQRGALVFALALWFTFLAATWFLILYGWQRVRAESRRRRGRCQHCGYDLRGSIEMGRCPECGTPFDLSDVETWTGS